MPPIVFDLPISAAVGGSSFALLKRTKYFNKRLVEILSICIALIYFNTIQFIWIRDNEWYPRSVWTLRLFFTMIFLGMYAVFFFFRKLLTRK